MQKNIDLSVLNSYEAILGRAHVHDFINQCLNQVNAMIDGIHDAFHHEDMEEVEHFAHQIRNMAGTLGAADLKKAAKDIENKAGADAQGIAPLLARLPGMLEECRNKLYEHYGL